MNFVETFVIQGQHDVNIVSLGAGFDTTSFWLQDVLKQRGDLGGKVCYVEIDYDQVVAKKIHCITQSKDLAAHIKMTAGIDPKEQFSDMHVNAANYKLLAHDLTQTETLTSVLAETYKVSSDKPTLVLTECLLIYLKAEETAKILNWVSEFFKPAPYVGLLNYEMINPFDAFGETMLENLAQRGCDLYGIEACPTLEAQVQRLKQHLSSAGVESADQVFANAVNMTQVYNRHLDATEKSRIERLEMFDEFEEWVLLQDHYCISFGSRGLGGTNKANGGNESVTII